MCGIAGGFDLQGQREFSQARLKAMTDAIIHRGPDDEGFYREPGLGLGARRLAILDLEGGHQPIANEDESIWVAFNGELFDYPELREDLLKRGHVLKTRCDTEAWAHLYEQHGLSMFEKAKGQFAVSLWNQRDRALILGRDRIGICPLYYTVVDGWLLWGSEVKALLASGLVQAKPDLKGLDTLFMLFSGGHSQTFFEGVRLIPPGHFLLVRDGRIQVQRYWDLDFPDQGQELRRDDPTSLVEELEDLLAKSVHRRLRGDVPVVSYLSGGLDSTVVLGVATRERQGPVRSFSIDLAKSSGPNEANEAKESAEVLGSPLTSLRMDSTDILKAFPDLIWATEGPLVDTSSACIMKLAEAVHEQGFKVALTGEGADEALAGYFWFKTHNRMRKMASRFGTKPMGWLRTLLLSSVARSSERRPPIRGFLGCRPAQQTMFELLGQTRSVLFSQDVRHQLKDHDVFDSLIQGHFSDDFPRWHPLNQSLYVGYKTLLAGLLMISKGDRVAMRSSVETRYPFLDEDFIEFCSKIDPNYKLQGKTEKWLLRQAAARVLPPSIANRPKTMFRSKMTQTFLCNHRPAWVDQLISPESLRKTGLFDPVQFARQCAWQTRIPRMTPARFVQDVAITCAITTQLWMHLFCGGGLCELPDKIGSARFDL